MSKFFLNSLMRELEGWQTCFKGGYKSLKDGYKRRESWNKITNLDTEQWNVTFGVIFSIGQKTFESLLEKNVICTLLIFCS